MKDSTKKLIEELRASTAKMHEEHLVEPASFVPPEERRAEFRDLAEYARAIDDEHPAVRATTKDDVMHLLAGALAWKQACPAMQRDADTVLQLVLWLAGMEYWRQRCERVDREAIASDLAEVLDEVEREVASLKKPLKRLGGLGTISGDAFQDGVEHQRKVSARRLEEMLGDWRRMWLKRWLGNMEPAIGNSTTQARR